MPNCRYLIVRDGKIEHLLRLADGSASSLASSDKPLSLYEALVADAGFSVVHLDVAAVSAPICGGSTGGCSCSRWRRRLSHAGNFPARQVSAVRPSSD
jgi:hypothetical protein